MIKVLVTDGKSKWVEEWSIPHWLINPTPQQINEYAKQVIQEFNENLRPGERPRQLIFVKTNIKNMKRQHIWTKTNLVTIASKSGSHDTYKCEQCGITGKRFGVGSITRDPKYKSEKYQYCEEK